MSTKVFAIAVSSVLLLCTFGGAARAQTPQLVSVTAPMAFTLGAGEFAPGDYTIGRSDDSNPTVMVLRAKTGGRSVLFIVAPVRGDSGPTFDECMFQTIAGKTYLTRIWTGGSASGLEVISSRVAINAARALELAANHEVTWQEQGTD